MLGRGYMEQSLQHYFGTRSVSWCRSKLTKEEKQLARETVVCWQRWDIGATSMQVPLIRLSISMVIIFRLRYFRCGYGYPRLRILIKISLLVRRSISAVRSTISQVKWRCWINDHQESCCKLAKFLHEATSWPSVKTITNAEELAEYLTQLVVDAFRAQILYVTAGILVSRHQLSLWYPS